MFNALIEAWKIVAAEAAKPQVTKRKDKVDSSGFNEYFDYDEGYRLIRESFEKKD